jgi:hydrogenase maturation protease
MRTLILGIGNPILTDDAVGLRVAGEIERLSLPDVHVIETSLAGTSILDFVAGYEKLVIIDSIKTGKGAPGTLYKLALEDITSPTSPSYSHGINILTAIKLGRKLGYEIPSVIEIYAVEVEDNTTFSEQCTLAVETRILDIAREIAESVRKENLESKTERAK